MSVLLVVVSVLVISVILCMIQAVRGGSAFDRVVSIDGLVVLSVGILVLFSVYFNESILMDIALVYAFVAFIADLAVAKHLEGRGLEE